MNSAEQAMNPAGRARGHWRKMAPSTGNFQWKVRHTVLAVLFGTSIISFLDRIAMSVAMPYIAADYHLGPVETGLVMSIFFAGYSISQVPGGMLADRFGVRRVATYAMLMWSGFTALTGIVTSVAQMMITRFLFGLGEGVFPSCAFKTVAIWFPAKERATANAIRLAASPLGAALAPLVVVAIMSMWGWKAVFLTMFVPGFLMALLFWLFVADRPSESALVSRAELAEIEEGGDTPDQGIEEKPSFRTVLCEPNIFKYFLVIFAYDIAYWGFTTWLPTYLVKVRGFSMVQMGLAASLPFFAGALGAILGGWISQRFFRTSRRTPLIIAQIVTAGLLYLIYTVTSLPMLIVCETLAGFCLNFFVAAFWALPMNSVPKRLMGIASGFINMGGQLAAFISPICIGYLVGAKGGGFNHAFMFLMAAVFISLLVVTCISSRTREA